MPRLRKIGIIDLGTNSIRFDAHSVTPDGKSHLLHREKLMVRLGEKVFLTGHLDAKAKDRTRRVLASFQATAHALGLERIEAFATSALREARDGEKFCREIRRDLRIKIEIISGKEEARLIAAGVLSHRKDARKDFALVDIGGGSTEISVCHDGKVIYSHSFPLGVARLQQVFLKTSPPSTRCLQDARDHVRAVLSRVLRDWPHIPRIIGSSGTVRALTKIARRTDGKKLTPLLMGELIDKMARLPPAELEKIPGMETKRRDLILAGAILLEECALHLGAKRVTATNFSLRDGMWQKVLAELPKTKPLTPKQASFHAARGWGLSEEMVEHRFQLAQKLFREFQAVRKLPESWEEILAIAFLLFDSGKRIAASQWKKHSAFIADHAELNLPDEAVDHLVRLCRQRDIDSHELWLLHLCVALEPIAPKATEIRVRLQDEIVLELPSHPNRELALLRALAYRESFEAISGKKILIT